jgi:hypothetical protein
MSRVFFGVFLVFAAGCTSGPAPPKTYTARGTVVYKDGKPMSGGSIELTTTDDPLLRVFGDIGADGSFSLTTVKDNARVDGAPAGQYRVMVQPPMVHDSRGGLEGAHKGVPAIAIPLPMRIEAGDNTNLKVEIPPGQGK